MITILNPEYQLSRTKGSRVMLKRLQQHKETLLTKERAETQKISYIVFIGCAAARMATQPKNLILRIISS